MMNRRTAKPWTEKELRIMKTHYPSMGPSITSLLPGRTNYAVRSAASKLGIKSSFRWTKDEDTILMDNYSWNPKIFDLLSGRTKSSIAYRAKYLGIKCDGRGRHNTLKADFFDKWTNEMAYILGIIVSDGNISKEHYRITIAQSDYPFLSTVADYLGLPDSIIYFAAKENSYKLQFTNKHITDRLAQLGVHPNKSLTQGKVHVPKKFFSHFLRGIHDGDGCFSHSKDGYSPHIVFTCGSYNFLRWIQAKVHKYYGFPMGRLRKSHVWRLRYRKAASLVLLAIMYKDKNDLYLQRKYHKYAAYMNDHTVRLGEFITSINARLPQNEVEDIVRSINIETKQVDWWKPVSGGYQRVQTYNAGTGNIL